MTNAIRIKRRSSGNAGAPASLKGSELAFNEVDGVLYYGKGADGNGDALTIEAIAGYGAYTTLTSNQSISGTKTITGTLDASGATAVHVPTLSNAENSTKAASTAFVQSVISSFGAGTVTSVALSLPNIFTVSGSPITGSGTLTGTLASQNSNTVFAGPSGSSGTPTFRSLVAADLPDLSSLYLSTTGGTISTNLTITGNLTVNGTTTTINSTTLAVDDKNIVLGDITSPTDATADGGGITLKGATDKSFNWIDATDSWTSSEHIELTAGKVFRIGGASVLSSTALGSGVTGSSLTSVGTIGTGTWQGTAVGVGYGGTGATSASAARTNLGLVIGTDVQGYDAELATLAGMSSGTATALAALTATEAGLVDGATITTAELNILDGDTAATATTLAITDRLVMNDGGNMVQVALSDLVTFFENGAVSGFDLDGGSF